MAALQAKALYDFDGASAGELTFRSNEILTILRQDIGDGWWEASNSSGKRGLVPETYLEITSFKEPSMPPPPPPSTLSWEPAAPKSSAVTPTSNRQSWGLPSPSAYSPVQAQPPPPLKPAYQPPTGARRGEEGEDWDDEWDDDDESVTTEIRDDGYRGGGYNGGGGTVGRSESRMSGTGTVRKPFNRFTSFSKAGGDDYLFDSHNAVVPASEKRAIIAECADGFAWVQTDVPFQCFVRSPKKETKFHGIKSFIAYQITPSFSNIQVSRRYKHFDWLQKRLVDKFTTIAIPPLPEKQIAGRFEDDFVNARLKQLQLWVDRMCKHPVVSQSDVFIHFLTCTDEKKWTQGKRKAEKDEYCGGRFFLTVQAPPIPVDSRQADSTLDKFGKFVRQMDDSLRLLYTAGENNVKKHQGPFKKEYQKLGNSWLTLAQSFKLDSRPVADGLTRAVEMTGQAYNDIGTMFAAQPQNDMFHLLEGLLEYKGLLSTFPDMLMVHKGTVNKIAESSAKLSEADLRGAQSRADVITYSLLAEMENFQKHRTGDFKSYMQTYLTGQIQFFSQITRKLEETLRYYDNV